MKLRAGRAVLGLMGALAGCAADPTDSGAGASSCGAGADVSLDGVAYCVYTDAIIETGFDCPPDRNYRYDFDGGVVCSEQGDRTPEQVQRAAEAGGVHPIDATADRRPLPFDTGPVPADARVPEAGGDAREALDVGQPSDGPTVPDDVPDARQAPDAGPSAPGCPANPINQEIHARPFETADESYHPLEEGITEFEGTVVAVEAGRITLQPAAETWQVTLMFPPEADPGLAPDDPVSVTLGLSMPFWEEWAFAVRGPAGLALVAVAGSLRWLDEPLALRDGLTVTVGGDCALRPSDCQDEIDHEVVFAGDGESLPLVGGQSGVLTIGAARYNVVLGTASTGDGEVRCTDLPGSWVSYVIGPER